MTIGSIRGAKGYTASQTPSTAAYGVWWWKWLQTSPWHGTITSSRRVRHDRGRLSPQGWRPRCHSVENQEGGAEAIKSQIALPSESVVYTCYAVVRRDPSSKPGYSRVKGVPEGPRNTTSCIVLIVSTPRKYCVVHSINGIHPPENTAWYTV